METTLHFDTSVSLSKLAQILKEQLPARDRQILADLLQEDEEAPSKEEILSRLKDDYIALQNGTLKTRPASEFLEELRREGHL
ncbi:hypothetical protein [Dyadobacter sp. CY312]|uniref:hypothetical protein n=1 Tax=Dyadobacter sp. CY312 TaxID=2907303 RepID=UPI001F338B4B|nr:hypothetical protein [Dyadobacter sp. CY312]MCE7044358.1 hypothetical protein [Dyadobacter sp. CY312]